MTIKTALLIFLTLISFAGLAEARQPTVISGRILIDDNKPMQGGLVLLYKKTSDAPSFALDTYRTFPDYTGHTSKNGSFIMTVPAGSYYLEAVQHPAGQGAGPPRLGELQLIGRDDKGQPKVFTVIANSRVDIGLLSGAQPYAGLQNITTGISGTVIDINKKPVANVAIFAFMNQEFEGEPAFISNKTGPDGIFNLGVSSGSTYYLVIHDFSNFPPKLTSKYGSDTPEPVIVHTGKITRDITIRK